MKGGSKQKVKKKQRWAYCSEFSGVLINEAIDAKCDPKISYPFDEYKISKFDVKTKKSAITKEDMLKVMYIDLSQEVESVRFARDIFVFSYLSGGISFTDIANLKSENIVEWRVKYIRKKTGK